MKQTLTVRSSVAVFSAAGLMVLIAIALAVGFGPLSPPAGAVNSTAKPLSEVEPRTAINAANTPGNASYMHIINSPGSYYLTGDVQATSGKYGIAVNASNVIIDLNGFSVIGASGASAAGITYLGLPNSITIRNGKVRGWTGNGIDLVGCADCTMSDLTLSSNAGTGIRSGSYNTIERCTVRGTSAIGIAANSFSVVIDCVVHDCTTGIDLNGSCSVRGTTVASATTGVQCTGGNVIRDCLIRCSTSGIASGTGIATNSFDNRFERNHLSFCTTGIALSSTGNMVIRNSYNRVTTPVVNPASNLVAPNVTAGTIGANTNPDANYVQ